MEYDSSIKYNVPNITLDDISLFIELSQLSVIDNLNFFHMEYTNTTSQANVRNYGFLNLIEHFINYKSNLLKLANMAPTETK